MCPAVILLHAHCSKLDSSNSGLAESKSPLYTNERDGITLRVEYPYTIVIIRPDPFSAISNDILSSQLISSN